MTCSRDLSQLPDLATGTGAPPVAGKARAASRCHHTLVPSRQEARLGTPPAGARASPLERCGCRAKGRKGPRGSRLWDMIQGSAVGQSSRQGCTDHRARAGLDTLHEGGRPACCGRHRTPGPLLSWPLAGPSTPALGSASCPLPVGGWCPWPPSADSCHLSPREPGPSAECLGGRPTCPAQATGHTVGMADSEVQCEAGPSSATPEPPCGQKGHPASVPAWPAPTWPGEAPQPRDGGTEVPSHHASGSGSLPGLTLGTGGSTALARKDTAGVACVRSQHSHAQVPALSPGWPSVGPRLSLSLLPSSCTVLGTAWLPQ